MSGCPGHHGDAEGFVFIVLPSGVASPWACQCRHQSVCVLGAVEGSVSPGRGALTATLRIPRTF